MGYGNMDWVEALKARKNPIDNEVRLASATEAEVVGDALQGTLNAAFNLSTAPENGQQALKRSSADIQDKLASKQLNDEISGIKAKLADRGIDPVALRVVTAEQWAQEMDPRSINEIAKKAALEFKKVQSQAWQNGVLNPQTSSMKYNEEAGMHREGRIMSCAAAGEDSVEKPGRIPSNANSIFDPFRLDRLAQEANEHDQSVASVKAGLKAREAEKKAELKYEVPEAEPMSSSMILSSGSPAAEAMRSRTAAHHISMVDTMGESGAKLTPEQMKEKLAALFTRVEDPREATIAANEQRKASIQRESTKKDRSWEKVSPPTSVTELHKRLMDLWPDPSK